MNTRNGLTFTPYVGLSLHEIEEMIATNLLVSKKNTLGEKRLYRNNFSTFSVLLSKISPGASFDTTPAVTSCDHISELLSETIDNLVQFGIPFVMQFSSISSLVEVLEKPSLTRHKNIVIGILSVPIIWMLAGRSEIALKFVNENFFGPNREKPLARGQVSYVEFGNRLLSRISGTVT